MACGDCGDGHYTHDCTTCKVKGDGGSRRTPSRTPRKRKGKGSRRGTGCGRAATKKAKQVVDGAGMEGREDGDDCAPVMAAATDRPSTVGVMIEHLPEDLLREIFMCVASPCQPLSIPGHPLPALSNPCQPLSIPVPTQHTPCPWLGSCPHIMRSCPTFCSWFGSCDHAIMRSCPTFCLPLYTCVLLSSSSADLAPTTYHHAPTTYHLPPWFAHACRAAALLVAYAQGSRDLSPSLPCCPVLSRSGMRVRDLRV